VLVNPLLGSAVLARRLPPLQSPATMDMCVHSHSPLSSAHINSRSPQIVGCRSGRATITLFPGALHALRQIHSGAHPAMRCATASSADTPRAVAIGRAALGIIEVVPGTTVLNVLSKGWPDGFDGHLQIGRTPPLSSDKAATHFPILHKHTLVPYEEMLFFDDCNWGDHVGHVEKRWGVVGQRTPNGMTVAEWEAGLALFAKRRS
jgi:magnesium-dependent phosphatase 1